MTKVSKYSVALFIISILIFSNSLYHQFTYDDRFIILTNSTIKTLKAIPWIFSHGTWPGELYRPLTMLTYALTYYFFQLNPLPYHLTNILLHAFITVIIFSLLKQILQPKSAFLTSLIFAIHPIHTEVIANISYRSELLTNLFGLSFIYFLLGYNPENHLRKKFCTGFLLAITLLLSLLSKESGLVFILIAPLYLIMKDLKSNIKIFLLSSLLALGIYFGLRINALGGLLSADPLLKTSYLDNPLITLSAPERTLNGFALLGKYLALCFFPLEQSADYSFAKLVPISNVNDGLFHLLIATSWVFITLIGLYQKLLGNLNQIFFWGLWFLCSFAITSNILLPIGTIFGERLAYLGSLAVCGLITEILLLLPSLFVQRSILSFLIIVFSWKTLYENQFWQNDHTLVAREIGISNQSARTQNNYASSMLDQGNPDQALIHFEKALQIYPEYAPSAHGITLAYLQKQDYSKAKEWAKKTLQINSNFQPSINLLHKLEQIQ